MLVSGEIEGYLAVVADSNLFGALALLCLVLILTGLRRGFRVAAPSCTDVRSVNDRRRDGAHRFLLCEFESSMNIYVRFAMCLVFHAAGCLAYVFVHDAVVAFKAFNGGLTIRGIAIGMAQDTFLYIFSR